MTVLLEACVTSPAEAHEAVARGAYRLELCTALEVEGLTPDPGLLRATLRAVAGAVPVFAMVRPEPGPHVCLAEARFVVLDAVRRCVDQGADGIVAGYLEPDRSWPDLELMRRIVDAAGSVGVTFHKAFDGVQDPEEAALALRDVGVARILTAGGTGRAVEHVDALRALVELQEAGRGPEIVVAGGVRGPHVADILDATGARALHARASAIPGIVQALGARRA